MKDRQDSDETTAPMVAPGYPAIETVQQIDVTGWEPATIFVAVSFPTVDQEEGAE